MDENKYLAIVKHKMIKSHPSNNLYILYNISLFLVMLKLFNLKRYMQPLNKIHRYFCMLLEDPIFVFVKTPITKVLELLLIWLKIYFIMHILTCVWMKNSNAVFESMLSGFSKYYNTISLDKNVKFLKHLSKSTNDRKLYEDFILKTKDYRSALEEAIYENYYQEFYLG